MMKPPSGVYGYEIPRLPNGQRPHPPGAVDADLAAGVAAIPLRPDGDPHHRIAGPVLKAWAPRRVLLYAICGDAPFLVHGGTGQGGSRFATNPYFDWRVSHRAPHRRTSSQVGDFVR
jgi:hypothetical protein